MGPAPLRTPSPAPRPPPDLRRVQLSREQVHADEGAGQAAFPQCRLGRAQALHIWGTGGQSCRGSPKPKRGTERHRRVGLEGEGLLGRRVDEAQNLQREQGGRALGVEAPVAEHWRGGWGAFYVPGPRSLLTARLCPLPPSCFIPSVTSPFGEAGQAAELGLGSNPALTQLGYLATVTQPL